MQVVSRKLIHGAHSRIYFRFWFLHANHLSYFKGGRGGVRGLRESGLPEVPVRPSRSGSISVKFDHVAIRNDKRRFSDIVRLLGVSYLPFSLSFSLFYFAVKNPRKSALFHNGRFDAKSS